MQMQDATELVYDALNSSTNLITLLGGKVAAKGWNRVYNSPNAPVAEEYPRITMFEVVNDDVNPSDDEPQDSDVNIRLDYWTKDETTIFPVCKQLKKDLKAAFNACSVRIERTEYEKDTRVFHKTINVFLLLGQGDDEA